MLNKNSLGAIVAGMTILGMFWTSASWTKDQTHKTDLLEQRVTNVEESQKKDRELAEIRGDRILSKMESLQKDVQTLTNALIKVEARQEL